MKSYTLSFSNPIQYLRVLKHELNLAKNKKMQNENKIIQYFLKANFFLQQKTTYFLDKKTGQSAEKCLQFEF